MNSKKFLMAGLLALVLAACIVAAGCTDSSSASVETAPSSSGAGDTVGETDSSVPADTESLSSGIFEIWGGTDSSGNQIYFVFYDDGSGVRYIVADQKYRLDKCSWEATNYGYYLVFDVESGVSMNVPLQYNTEHTALTDNSGFTLTKQTEVPVLK